MEKDVNKKQNITILCLVILIICFCAGITYAFFTAMKQSDNKTVSTGSFDITYTEDTDVINLDSNTTPILDEDYETSASKLNFTIKNTGTLDAYSTIKMNVTYTDGVDNGTTVTDSAKTSDYKWALKRDDEKVTSGTFADGDSEITISNMESFNGKNGNTYDTKNYTLYVWASETWEDQSSLKQSGLSISLEVDSTNNSVETLTNAILGDNYSNVLSGDYNITNDFTCTDTSCTKNYADGIYKSVSTNNGYPTYYYRGNVENNYVKFATYSESGSYTYKKLNTNTTFSYTKNSNILWRIVRINEDNTIRLISENINSSSDSINNNETNLENFYNKHLSSFDSLISKQNYCKDDYGYSIDRVTNTTPTFECPTVLSNYKKYGSITLDELAFSGVYVDTLYSVSESYLNNDSWFYTTSKNSLLNPSSNLIVSDQNLDSSSSRIVINLKADALITSGSGTKSDPWIVK